MTASQPAPVAVGAIGGSGTRVVARFLDDAGYYMGSDLNRAHDNLWFTLLFIRPDVLVEPPHVFERLVRIFYRRMTGGLDADARLSRIVEALAARPRPQHKADWLRARAASLLDTADMAVPARWGWKAPNTHIVIDRLLELDPRLRYVHVTRNGLDMAFSENQNQLQLWGPVLLNRDIALTPRDSLAYWCAAHRRMRAIARRHPERVMFLDFDRLCREPAAVCGALCRFLGHQPPEAVISRFAATVETPASRGRFRRQPDAAFDPGDVGFVARWGYPTS